MYMRVYSLCFYLAGVDGAVAGTDVEVGLEIESGDVAVAEIEIGTGKGIIAVHEFTELSYHSISAHHSAHVSFSYLFCKGNSVKLLPSNFFSA